MGNEEKQVEMMEELRVKLLTLPDYLKNNDKNYLNYYISRMKDIIKQGGTLEKTGSGQTIIASIKRKNPDFNFMGMEDLKELESISIYIDNEEVKVEEKSNELRHNETYLSNLTSDSYIQYKAVNGGGYNEYTKRSFRTNSFAKDVKVSNVCQVQIQDQIINRDYTKEGYIAVDRHFYADPIENKAQRNLFEFQSFSGAIRSYVDEMNMPNSESYFSVPSKEKSDNYIVRIVKNKKGEELLLCKSDLSKTPYVEYDSYYESNGKKITRQEYNAIRSIIPSEYVEPSKLLEEQKII
jgi:hypothetical protein